jgi:hypothetical protein
MEQRDGKAEDKSSATPRRCKEPLRYPMIAGWAGCSACLKGAGREQNEEQLTTRSVARITRMWCGMRDGKLIGAHLMSESVGRSSRGVN